MPQHDSYTDIVELCALLQCLGFSVKSLDTCDVNLSQDGAARTVVINCQASGWNVVLEGAWPCSCPAINKQNSGVWQVSGVTGGKQLDKEFGCTLLGSLPKAHRERLSSQLQDIIRCIMQFSGVSDTDDKPKEINKSASMIELSTPEKLLFQAKVDTPTRYRSLDTLTTTSKEEQPFPAPRPLQRHITNVNADDEKQDVQKTMCTRQSTYTLSSTPGSGSMRKTRNKTSSPIQSQHTMLDSLIAAEKAAEDLKNKIASVIREFVEERNDSSISSLVLDVSKISVLKGETSKAQFASSPNLSKLGSVKEDFPKSRLKRFGSSSTSDLAPKVTPNTDGKSKLRRLSPNIFKLKKDSPGVKAGLKGPESRSKLNSIFKPKIATPVRKSVEGSPNLSATKRKFSHVKSTIPRPMKKE